ncbi:MAG: hypothetical protein E7621_04005 [Ruminococcaceae bacterium]|nr:hypothetical protein [Oscillospiraceae bacterium]
MSIYYVSANGCDKNDGLTPETAWKSISKVNETIAGGDEVRFRCGDTFYGKIWAKDGISADKPTTYTSYGEGKKPVVCEYKIARSGAWEKVSENVYKLDMADTSKFDGNTTDIDSNAGFIKVDGKIFYVKRVRLEDLSQQWDFFCDDDNLTLYVYSEKCPCEMAKEIKIACNVGCLCFATNIKVTNIVFNGTGAHGINGTTGGAYIENCEFHEIGGSRLPFYPHPDTRYGNGVECWSNSHDVTIKGCKFSDVYDVAFTMQGTEVKTSWKNIHFVDNIIWNCTQAFEIWSSGDVPNTGFEECYFQRNTCINSGNCWGGVARPNKDVSAHLLVYHLDCPLCDVTVSDNYFYIANVSSIYKRGGPRELPETYKIYGNTFVCPKGQDIISREGNTDEEFEAFRKKIYENNTVIDFIDYEK